MLQTPPRGGAARAAGQLLRAVCRVGRWAAGALVAACWPGAGERAAAAMEREAEAQGLVLRAMLDGRPLALMVRDCRVYDLADRPDRKGRRPVRLEPEFYLGPTSCARQSIATDAGWVTVTIGRMAFGAGGCCASGGTYRTRDGRAWEKRVRGAWVAQAADAAEARPAGADAAEAAGPGGVGADVPARPEGR